MLLLTGCAGSSAFERQTSARYAHDRQQQRGTKRMKVVWDDELSDREIYLIGKVVAHWGAMEHEIFLQTIQTFEPVPGEDPEVPKAMRRPEFSSLLTLIRK